MLSRVSRSLQVSTPSYEAPLPVPWVAGLVPWAVMGC